VHVVCAWATVVVHALPQVEQFCGSLVVFTQALPQGMDVAAGHPEAQA